MESVPCLAPLIAKSAPSAHAEGPWTRRTSHQPPREECGRACCERTDRSMIGIDAPRWYADCRAAESAQQKGSRKKERMSASQPAPSVRAIPRVAAGAQLAERTRGVAAQMYATVAEAYLGFRRAHYHESSPSLATIPPPNDEVQRTEAARLALDGLRLVPREAMAVALVRDICAHLHWVVDIHSLTERERRTIHNMTMIVLRGMQDGIQPWYVNWMLGTAHDLQGVTHPEYYLAFPWQALLYRDPEELAHFDEVVRAGDCEGMTREAQHTAEQLTAVLHDPLAAQAELAFGGPEGEQRRRIFHLKTSAGLALGAYLAAETMRNLVKSSQTEPLRSVIRAFPPELDQHLIEDVGA